MSRCEGERVPEINKVLKAMLKLNKIARDDEFSAVRSYWTILKEPYFRARETTSGRISAFPMRMSMRSPRSLRIL
jgi:hypothetical protein